MRQRCRKPKDAMRASFRRNEHVRIKRVNTIATVDFIEHDGLDSRMKRKVTVTRCALFCDEAVYSSWMMRTRRPLIRVNTALASLANEILSRARQPIGPLPEWRTPSPKHFITYDADLFPEILRRTLPSPLGNLWANHQGCLAKRDSRRRANIRFSSACARRIDSSAKSLQDFAEVFKRLPLVGPELFEQFIVGRHF